MDLLQVQNKLNTDYEQAFMLATNSINVQPMLERELSPEELRANLILQRQQLAQKLQGTMTSTEIVNFLNTLSDDETIKLNQFWEGFQKELKGRKNFKADELLDTWKAYESGLTSGGLSKKDVQANKVIEQNLLDLEKSLSIGDPERGYPPRLSPENAKRLKEKARPYESWLVETYIPTLWRSIPSFAQFYNVRSRKVYGEAIFSLEDTNWVKGVDASFGYMRFRYRREYGIPDYTAS